LSNFDGHPREIILKISRPTGGLNSEGKKVTELIHVEKFSSSVSDLALSLFAKNQIAELQGIEEMCRLAEAVTPSDSSSVPASPGKLFAIHIRDVQLDIASAPIILPGSPSDTVETFLANLLGHLKSEVKRCVSILHQAMIAEVERRGWSFNDLRRGERAKERWREICATTHPLWLAYMTEAERGAFAKTSRETIIKNLTTGRVSSKNFVRTRTPRLTSVKTRDKIPRVRKGLKKPR
jgi:hypothetical protein